ncbi:hypothetical protein B0H14DRAFT_3467227 [Mycena olivaceomarginata]|nr:hypothetical protein B0H14DRAFT_3467227 [Mycena olivaceomarginata]
MPSEYKQSAPALFTPHSTTAMLGALPVTHPCSSLHGLLPNDLRSSVEARSVHDALSAALPLPVIDVELVNASPRAGVTTARAVHFAQAAHGLLALILRECLSANIALEIVSDLELYAL